MKFNLQEKDYLAIFSQVKTFFETIFNSSGVRKRHVQSILFHFAIINTKQRAMIRNDGLYECLPHPGYILGKSYFGCQEDLFVKVALIKDVYVKHPDLMQDLKAKNLYNFIITSKDDFVSYDKIHSINVSYIHLMSPKRIIYNR